MLKKRIISILLIIVMTVGMLPVLSYANNTGSGSGDTSSNPYNISKTMEWVDGTDNTKIKISIQSDVPHEAVTRSNVLFLSSLCSAHNLTGTTLSSALSSIQNTADCTYHFFSNCDEKYSGTITSSSTIPSITDLAQGKHMSLAAFIDCLYTELITNNKSYDYIILLFDSAGLADPKEGAGKPDKSQMNALKDILTKYYNDHKVIWVTNENTSYAYAYADSSGNISKTADNQLQSSGNDKKLTSGRYNSLKSVLCPSEYDASIADDTSTTDGTEVLTSFNKPTDSEGNLMVVGYTNSSKLNSLLSKYIASTTTMKFEDKIKLPSSITIESVKVYTGKSSDNNVVTWTELANPNVTINNTTNEISYTVDVTDTDIDKIKLEITVYNSNGFREIMEVSGDTTVINPNNGSAKVSINNTSREADAQIITPIEITEFNITTSAINGSITESQYNISKGQSRTITFSPNDGYVLKSITVDGVDKTAYYSSSSSITFSDINLDHSVAVEYQEVNIAVTKSSDKTTANAGDEIVYTLNVAHNISSPVTGITVSDTIPQHVSFVSCTEGGAYDDQNRTVTWSNQTIAAGSGNTYTITVKADLDIEETKTIVNTAKAKLGSTESTSNESTVVVNPKQVSVTYHYVDGGIVPSGAVLPTEENSFNYGYEYQAKEQTPVNGFTFTGWYTLDTETMTYAPYTSSKLTSDLDLYGSWIPIKSLSIEKVAKQDGTAVTEVTPGISFTYEIKVSNTSQVQLTDVSVIDTLPEGLVYVESSANLNGAYNSEDRTVSWVIDIPANQVKTLTFNAYVESNITSLNEYVNSASVYEDGKPYGTSTYTVSARPLPENFTITKWWSDDWSAHENESVTARIYQKIGETETLYSTVTIGAQGWHGALPVYTDAGLPITYRIEEETVSGYENVIEENYAENAFLIKNYKNFDPSNLSISKSVDNSKISEGIIVYTLSVTSNYYRELKNIIVKDTIAQGLTVNNHTETCGNALIENNEYTWTFDLLSGNTAQATITVNVPDDVYAEEYSNTARVVSAEDSEYTTPTESETVYSDIRKVQISKIWANITPTNETVNVILYRDGIEYKTAELNTANRYTVLFDSLPLYQDGTKVPSVYTVKELDMADYYNVEYSYTADDTFGLICTKITNTLLCHNVNYQYSGQYPVGTLELLPSDDTNILHGSAYCSKSTDNISAYGWNFYGWYTDAQCTKPYVDGTALNSDMTLYGRWERTPLTVNFEYTGTVPDGVTPPSEQSVYMGDTAHVPANPDVPAGYVFEGFSFDFTTPIYENTTVYGNWKTTDYKITYNLDGGELPASTSNPTTYNVTTPTFTLNNPTKTGYTFVGWTGTDLTDETTSVSVATGSVGDRTYTANYVPNTDTKYRVEHYKQRTDGTYPSSPDDSYNSAGTTGASVTPPTNSYEGYTSPALQTVTIAADGSTVVKYYYVLKTATITFVSNGGSSVPAQTVYYGARGSTPSNPYYNGYSFVGWYTADGVKFDFSTPITSDIILYARWNYTGGRVKTGDGDVSLFIGITIIASVILISSLAVVSRMQHASDGIALSDSPTEKASNIQTRNKSRKKSKEYKPPWKD